MRIGILKTGDVAETMVGRYGTYPDMFSALLRSVNPDYEFLVVDVDGGGPLGEPTAADGWLITGSRHGVYEDHSWIEPLKVFLRDAIAAGIPVFGVCFGHQILAEALGGKVIKSDRGWAVGVQDYATENVPDWMDGVVDAWSAHAFHQDQIVELPQGATVLASSPHCPYAAMLIGDPEAPDAISVQPHPEYGADFLRDLIDIRLQGKVAPEILDAGLESLGRPVDGLAWAKVMDSYFRRVAARRDSLGRESAAL